MNWQKILKFQEQQIVQNFYDAMDNYEKIMEESVSARRMGNFQTEEQVRPHLTKQLEALKAIQGTIGQYIQTIEGAL